MAGAKRVPLVTSPVMRKPEPRAERLEPKKEKSGWCLFSARSRCYVAGVLLEDAEQEITLSPRDSYLMRNSKVLYLVSGEIPVFSLPEGIKAGTEEAKLAEATFLDDLDDGDPKVGPAPSGLKLIKQA